MPPRLALDRCRAEGCRGAKGSASLILRHVDFGSSRRPCARLAGALPPAQDHACRILRDSPSAFEVVQARAAKSPRGLRVLRAMGSRNGLELLAFGGGRCLAGYEDRLAEALCQILQGGKSQQDTLICRSCRAPIFDPVSPPCPPSHPHEPPRRSAHGVSLAVCHIGPHRIGCPRSNASPLDFRLVPLREHLIYERRTIRERNGGVRPCYLWPKKDISCILHLGGKKWVLRISGIP